MDEREINLEIITKQYRKKGAAAKGFRAINTLIKNNDDICLHILLRNHFDSPIDSSIEVEERNNIDFLIDYFSIIEIGLIANYLPNPLPIKTEKDIILILNNQFVYKYISEYYPLALPQLLLKQISKSRGEKYFYTDNFKENTALFDRFLLLNQIVRNDNDIQQFLWFLDDGRTSGFSISDFWDVLHDINILNHKLSISIKHPLNSALWGFIKYIQFLTDFANLLRECKEDPLLQSAFWHHHSYWFEHMKERIGDIINVGIKNIHQSMHNVIEEDILRNKNSFLDSKDDIFNWRSDTSQIVGVQTDINFLLNHKLGEPLKKLFK